MLVVETIVVVGCPDCWRLLVGLSIPAAIRLAMLPIVTCLWCPPGLALVVWEWKVYALGG